VVKRSHFLKVSEEGLGQFFDLSQTLRTGVNSIIKSSGIELRLNDPH